MVTSAAKIVTPNDRHQPGSRLEQFIRARSEDTIYSSSFSPKNDDIAWNKYAAVQFSRLFGGVFDGMLID
jgi:hypothetical protein